MSHLVSSFWHMTVVERRINDLAAARRTAYQPLCRDKEQTKPRAQLKSADDDCTISRVSDPVVCSRSARASPRMRFPYRDLFAALSVSNQPTVRYSTEASPLGPSTFAAGGQAPGHARRGLMIAPAAFELSLGHATCDTGPTSRRARVAREPDPQSRSLPFAPDE
jgi:hypothetical protein